jgi:hypothetical protein
MKKGMSLVELAAEIERRAGAKQDIVSPVEKLELVVVEAKGKPEVRLAVANGRKETFRIKAHAHRQLAEYTGTPLDHYRRMQEEALERLAREVNRSMKSKAKDQRMLRTLDGAVWAFLNDRYVALENEDVAEAVLPVLKERDLIVTSCAITETRLYIKAVDRSIERDIPTGRMLGDGSHAFFDTISPGIVISNSEVGAGSFSIETSIWTGGCTNLAIIETARRKHHLDAFFSDDGKRLTAAAIRDQVRDLVARAFDEAKLDAQARKLRLAVEDHIEPSDVVEVVERVGEQFTINEHERKSVLQHLIEGDDLTRYGLHAAITRASADVEDYDRATELERLGGAVINLAPGEWQLISQPVPRVSRATRRAAS